MEVVDLSYNDIFELVKKLPKPSNSDVVCGIPRAGAIVACMYASLHRVSYVNDPNKATIVIDDVVSKGRTLRELNLPKETKFYALVWEEEKSGISCKDNFAAPLVNPKQWLKFPWEYRVSEDYDREDVVTNGATI